MTLQAYLKRRRLFETAMFVTVTAIGCFSNVATEIVDYARNDIGLATPIAWILEGTSHLALLAAIPLVLWFDARFPLRMANWRRSVPAHLAFTVVFSAVHVALMYAGRKLLYPLVLNASYGWDNVPAEFGYEYLKDFRTYFLILALVYLYRFIVLRLRGEAGFLDADEAPEPAAPPVDRFLVKKLGREFLVRTEDIEWIESAGNYVNLHVDQRIYPLRGTMTQIAERLQPQGFIRVHRQAIVNADRIAEMSVFDSGDGELLLRSSAKVPVSRRFRQQLRSAIGAASANA